ncbi:hypothetical protein [Pseudonocardia humida]|uniref:Uncharacterized protein n=1 Tax=Pseudonocardia humida TaxID=2800819 RepID=A0ABT1ADF8_9PSEU|nr:hypothetical protein [Pseudonocardia humida]MCO1661107.1 hypothetical protein [Pseudonocardia humida]
MLGIIATDAVMGRRTAQQALKEYWRILSRLPEGSTARRQLDLAIRFDLDAPTTPVPDVPSGTPGPLRDLVTDLHAVPLVRRDPSKELEPLLAVIGDVVAGRISSREAAAAVRHLANRRHESLGEAGKFEIDRRVRQAVETLEEQRRRDRRGTGSYPAPATKPAPARQQRQARRNGYAGNRWYSTVFGLRCR